MANTPTIPKVQQHRPRTHFGMVALPFRENVGARQMFDSSSQRDPGHALPIWLDLRALALVTGAGGVGESITVRRFVSELDEARFTVHRFGQIPTTPTGFLRALCRRMGLPMRRYTGDMFDDVTTLLKRTHGRRGGGPGGARALRPADDPAVPDGHGRPGGGRGRRRRGEAVAGHRGGPRRGSGGRSARPGGPEAATVGGQPPQ